MRTGRPLQACRILRRSTYRNHPNHSWISGASRFLTNGPCGKKKPRHCEGLTKPHIVLAAETWIGAGDARKLGSSLSLSLHIYIGETYRFPKHTLSHVKYCKYNRQHFIANWCIEFLGLIIIHVSRWKDFCTLDVYSNLFKHFLYIGCNDVILIRP
jgi:hypothetical protein